MKDIFKKYLYSKITHAEFEQLSDFIMKEENTKTVYEMMNPEWNLSLHTVDESDVPKSHIFEWIIQQILQDEARNALRKVRIYSISLRVAAVLVFGLIFSSIWFYMQSNKVSGFEQTQTVSIPYGAKKKLALPDGSIVWLNSGTTMSYSGNFLKKT